MKKLKYIFISLAATLVLGFSLGAAPALALAGCGSDQTPTTKEAIQGGINAASGNSSQDCKASSNAGSSLDKIIKLILNLLSIIVGVLAVAMIIISGLRFVTSGGNEEGVKTAKNTLIYAIVGLVIVALAQVIVHFVLNEVNTQVVSASNKK